MKTIIFPYVQISSLSRDMEEFSVKNSKSVIYTNWIASIVYKELHKFYWEYFKSNLVLF